MSLSSCTDLQGKLCEVSVCFEQLPDHILTTIFFKSIETSSISEVNKTFFHGRLVCKRFRRLFDEPRIIALLLEKCRSLPLSIIRKIPQKEFYQPLMRYSYETLLRKILNKNGLIGDTIPFLEGLEADERAHITYVSLSLLEPFLPKKIYKKDGYIEIRSPDKERRNEFERFLTLLPNLQTLRFPLQLDKFTYLFHILSSSATQMNRIEMQSLRSEDKIIKYFKERKLKSLYLTECELTHHSLEQIFTQHPEIEELTLLNTPKVCLHTLNIPSNLSLKKIALRGMNFGNQTTDFLLTRFPKLICLDIASTANDKKAISQILNCSLSLQELNLSHLNIRDFHFSEISSSLKNHLRVLKLYGCREMTKSAIADIFQAFPNLEQLDIRYCSIKGSIFFPHHCESDSEWGNCRRAVVRKQPSLIQFEETCEKCQRIEKPLEILTSSHLHVAQVEA